MDSLHIALRELAVAAAEEAAAYLLERRFAPRVALETKTSPVDMVSEVDLGSETLIAARILGARPGDALVGEEGGLRGSGASGIRWYVDPLDGTTNYLYGRGDFAVSIAAEQNGAIVAGAVTDVVHAITYSASRGGGADANGEAISVSAKSELATALLGTGFGYLPDVRRRQGAVAGRVVPHVRDLRRAGAAALDLCAVACGQLDAYYETGLGPWDKAAGSLIVQEAGGAITDVRIDLELPPAIIAANPLLLPLLADLLRLRE